MWTADIGCWEYGKNVDLPDAKDLNEALKKANEILATVKFSRPIKDPYVVQVYNNEGKVVFDYMNGGY